MYKRNGKYYILATHPASAEYTLQASSPFGTYTSKVLANSLTPPVSGGNPHQGGIVDAGNDNWYYMAFEDNYPGGRIPVLAPITWGSDGFPTLQVRCHTCALVTCDTNLPALQLVNGAWGASYSNPLTAHSVPSLTGTDTLTSIGPQWEWNHNPDTTKFSVGSGGLTLSTATVTYDLYSARNTISHRILGPSSTATIKMSVGSMIDGDRAGLALLRDQSGWVGVSRDSGALTIRMVTNINI